MTADGEHWKITEQISFAVPRLQPAWQTPPGSLRYVRRDDRPPASEAPSFRSFSFTGVVQHQRVLSFGQNSQVSQVTVRGFHRRSGGFHWLFGLRYFLIPVATGVLLFGAEYVQEQWRQRCLRGRKSRRTSIDMRFGDDEDDYAPYAPWPPPSPPPSPGSSTASSSGSDEFTPVPPPPLPPPDSIPSILKKKKQEEEGATKKEEEGETKKEDEKKVTFTPEVKKE